MAQTSSLSDALQPSSLSGLLAQLDSALGDQLSQSDMFSNLLSQTGSMNSSLAALTQTPLVTTQANAAPSFMSTSASGNNPTSSPQDSLLQNLDSLSSALHQALALLHQQNNGSNSSSSQTSQNDGGTGQTQTGNGANSGQTNTQTGQTGTTVGTVSTTATDTNQNTNDASTTTSSSSDSPKSLSDIIAEILAMVQTMKKELQQAQVTSGGASTTQADALAGTAGGASNDSLQQMQQALQKIAQKLAPASGGETIDANTSAASDTSSPFAAIEAELKNVIAGLQLQNANATSAATPANAAAAAMAQKTADPAKAALADAGLSQMVPATPPAAAPLPAVFAASAAMNANTDTENGGFNGGSDTASNGNNAFSSAVNNDSGVTAEGANVTGTYNFASTLSAFRAANGGTAGLPSVVDQVILQMNRNFKNGDDQMSLQLQPGDLGKITVKLDFSNDGKVQGTVTADTQQTLTMLQKDSRSLERALQDAGLRADPGSLQFNLGGQSGNNAGQATNNNANASGNGTGDGTVSADDTDGTVALGATVENYYITPTGVNIQV